VPVLGITCKRLEDAIRDQNGSEIARAFRVALRLVREIP
jgi:hypothetical protein